MAVVMPYNFVAHEVWVWYNQIDKSVFVEEKMKDRCLGCSLFNVKKTGEWKCIEGYEGRYRISDKGDIEYWENNKKEWKAKKTEGTTVVIIMLDFPNLGK